MDLRAGGRWRSVAVTHDGFEVAFHGEYLEIVENERIVCTEVYEAPGAEAVEAEAPLNIVTFTEVDGHMVLRLLARCPNKAVRDTIMASGMEAGMQEGMDLLEQVAISLA